MKFSKFLRLVSFAAMLLPLSAQAQLIKGYGAKVGVNSSKATLFAVKSAYEELETERRAGVNAALFLEWGASSVISLVTQVEYAQRGFAEEQVVTGENGPEPIQVVRANTRLDYVSLPVLVKLQSSPGPYLVLGPRVDFLVNRVAGVFEFSIGNFESPLSQGFDDQALGGTVGLGFSTDKLLRLPLLIETRYNFDFTDSADNQTLGQAKINSFDVWLGIKL